MASVVPQTHNSFSSPRDQSREMVRAVNTAPLSRRRTRTQLRVLKRPDQETLALPSSIFPSHSQSQVTGSSFQAQLPDETQESRSPQVCDSHLTNQHFSSDSVQGISCFSCHLISRTQERKHPYGETGSEEVKRLAQDIMEPQSEDSSPDLPLLKDICRVDTRWSSRCLGEAGWEH